MCVCVCVSAFQRFLGKDDVSKELEDVHAEARTQETLQTASVFQLMKSPAVRWQLITVVVTMASYQLCGLNAVSCSTLSAFQGKHVNHLGQTSTSISNATCLSQTELKTKKKRCCL